MFTKLDCQLTKQGVNDLPLQLSIDKMGENDLQVKLLLDKTGENSIRLIAVERKNICLPATTTRLKIVAYSTRLWDVAKLPT